MRAEPPPAITRLFPTGGRLFWKFFLAFWIALLIAAGAVVTKNVEPNTVVAGNPAVVVKKFP